MFVDEVKVFASVDSPRGVAVDGRTQVVLEVSLGWGPGAPSTDETPSGLAPPPCYSGKLFCDEGSGSASSPEPCKTTSQNDSGSMFQGTSRETL